MKYVSWLIGSVIIILNIFQELIVLVKSDQCCSLLGVLIFFLLNPNSLWHCGQVLLIES